MKLIIAGSRNLYPTFGFINSAIRMLGVSKITEVVSGRATGVDTEGEHWAHHLGLPIQPFPADWDNIDVPGAVVKTRKDGSKYNAVAGLWRNVEMAEYADALILIWDGKSSGSYNMKSEMEKLNKPIYEVILKS